jgi:hypothetical protein
MYIDILADGRSIRSLSNNNNNHNNIYISMKEMSQRYSPSYTIRHYFLEPHYHQSLAPDLEG